MAAIHQKEDTGPDALAAHNVVAGYGGATNVLEDVSLVVPRGRMTVLAGPNGSGKSTLLLLLSRVLKASHGSIHIDGKTMADLPTREIARKLGLLPQGLAVPEGISVYDLVSRGRYPHQGFLKQWTAADERAVVEALAATALMELAERPVASLSGGQRQRCFIAMTLTQETPILLFDEPTTFLDLKYQIEIMELIASLPHRHGRTVVAVLHDLNAAMHYADRIVFMKAGRIRHVVEDPQACTPDLIGDVYGARVCAITHPVTGKLAFLPDVSPR